MSLTSIHAATVDQALINRVNAACARQAFVSESFEGTNFAARVRDYPDAGAQRLIWPVAIDYEDEYEYAVGSSNPNPGGDPGVITDENIEAAVQTHWPSDDEIPDMRPGATP